MFLKRPSNDREVARGIRRPLHTLPGGSGRLVCRIGTSQKTDMGKHCASRSYPKNMRHALTALTVTALAGLASACGIASSTGEPRSPVITAITGPPSPQTVISCPDCLLVNVTNVVDGATFDTGVGRVRVFGVDTPERGDTCFSEATAATERLTGSQVRLEDGPRLTDSFGRRLGYVYDASGNSIDVQLVAGGFARAWTRDGQHRDLLIGLEQSAREHGAGCLWG